MVTAVTTTPNPKQPPCRRPPLLPSDSSDNNAPPQPPPRRAKSRQVTSRYLSLSSSSSTSTNTTSSSSSSSSSISSQRPHSPMRKASLTVTATPKTTQQRAVSSERRRPIATPSNAERMLVVTSMRSLSVSFQGESYSVPVSKERKCTPERRKLGIISTPVRDGRENSRPNDLQRWPAARLRAENPSVIITRSLDLDRFRISMDDGSKIGVESKPDNNSLEVSGLGSVPLRGRPRKLVVPPRLGQLQGPASPLTSKSGPSKLNVANKFQNVSPASSPRGAFVSRGLSPLRGNVRAASPSKTLTPSPGALVRGMPSPMRHRAGVGNSVNDSNTCCSTPSMLSYAADVRRGGGKLGENRIADAHELRLLYNRQLQWRFANARAENSLLVQKHSAEKSLYNAWLTTSKLQQSVKLKRIELQLCRHNIKLYSILKEQEPHLENWSQFDTDHSDSLSGATEALEASTVRLPVIGGARADVQKVKKAIFSAVDVMQAMASSICPLLLKVEKTNLLVSELSDLSARERALLDEWRDLLSTRFMPLQVTHCSLATHVLQAQRLPSNKKTATL